MVRKFLGALLFCSFRWQLRLKTYGLWVKIVRPIQRRGEDSPACFQQLFQLPSISDFHAIVNYGEPHCRDERSACCERCGQATTGGLFHAFCGYKAVPVTCVFCYGRCLSLFVQYVWETVGGEQMCHIQHLEWKDVWNIDMFDQTLPAKGIKGTLSC